MKLKLAKRALIQLVPLLVVCCLTSADGHLFQGEAQPSSISDSKQRSSHQSAGLNTAQSLTAAGEDELDELDEVEEEKNADFIKHLQNRMESAAGSVEPSKNRNQQVAGDIGSETAKVLFDSREQETLNGFDKHAPSSLAASFWPGSLPKSSHTELGDDSKG